MRKTTHNKRLCEITMEKQNQQKLTAAGTHNSPCARLQPGFQANRHHDILKNNRKKLTQVRWWRLRSALVQHHFVT